MKVSIIIPAYNEEKRIGKTLEGYSSYFRKIQRNLSYEILVVLNATTDGTEKIVKSFKNKDRHIRYLNLKRGGKGYAVIEGFKDALKREPDLIGFVDADMATSPQSYHDLINKINDADGAIASRYIPGSKVHPKPTIARRIVSRMFNALGRSLFLMPYRDTQCGAKVFKRRALQQVLPHFSMSQWAFDVELLYLFRREGYNIKEVPTVWSDKAYSKINFLKSGPFMALGILRLRLINSPLKFIIRLYDFVVEMLRR